jgi:hypothetical protein
MPQARRRRKKGVAQPQKAVMRPESPTIQDEGKPTRGVKLRTVSRLTMVFALACLAAFMAGRPPASRAGAIRGRRENPTVVGSRAPANQAKHLKRVASLGR